MNRRYTITQKWRDPDDEMFKLILLLDSIPSRARFCSFSLMLCLPPSRFSLPVPLSALFSSMGWETHIYAPTSVDFLRCLISVQRFAMAIAEPTFLGDIFEL